jgi:hypothetical protein
MKYTVITTFHRAGLEQYGQRMIDSFEKYWPADVDLIVLAENCQPRVSRPNTHVIDLLTVSDDLRNFVSRHQNNPLAHGQAGPPDVFNPKKQFRWDAVRFCYKVYAKAVAADMIDSGWMIWIDADTVTHSPIPTNWLPSVCPHDAMISYLGRGENYHSECGWVGYNLDQGECRQFIQDFVNMYNSDEIFKLQESHDSYVWDTLRRQFLNRCKFYNLNTLAQTDARAGHPFINSDLGKYMDHLKGNRKTLGKSKSTDLKIKRNEDYWQLLP